MSTKIQLRRDLAANWTSVNPILSQGEIGLETDTIKIKFGDGITAWNSLSYGVFGAISGTTGTIPKFTSSTSIGNSIITEATGTISIAGTLDLGSNNLTGTGSIASTGIRILKGWFTDIEITNLPTINGGTLATALGNYGGFLTSVTSNAPLTGSGTSGSHLSIPVATSIADGYLSSTDWTTFNNKLSSVTPHNILSVTHSDTLADTVVRGDIIYGNATPKWSRLPFPATPTDKILQATATDIAWSANPLTIGASASVSGTNTGDNAANSSTMYIGTTAQALNRASAAEGLTGITSLTPGADFTLAQNSVNVLTSVSTGAIVNTLYLKEGNVGIGKTTPGEKLDILNGNIKAQNNISPYGVGFYSPNNVYLAANQYLDIPNGIYKAASTGSSSCLSLTYDIGFQFFSGSSVTGGTAVTNTEVMRLSRAGGLSLGSGYVSTNPGAGSMIISGNVGIGTTSLTAYLHLKAGTATVNTAPLKLTSGVVNTTPETGALEYNGTNLSFVPTGTLRETIHTGGRGSITLTAGTTTTVTAATAKTTSTIIISPTSLAVIALTPYVSTKSNGSFVITTLTAAGTETLDYLIIN